MNCVSDHVQLDTTSLTSRDQSWKCNETQHRVVFVLSKIDPDEKAQLNGIWVTTQYNLTQ